MRIFFKFKFYKSIGKIQIHNIQQTFLVCLLQVMNHRISPPRLLYAFSHSTISDTERKSRKDMETFDNEEDHLK